MIDPNLARDAVILLSQSFRRTTAAELWQEGLDYGEDEEAGHTIEEMTNEALLPPGAYCIVRVSWYDDKEKAHFVCLHTHFLGIEASSKVLEMKFYET